MATWIMSEGEIDLVKTDALKTSLRNVNVTVKVVDIGEARSVTSRRTILCTELQRPLWGGMKLDTYR